jgi:hypothetical protein
MDVAGLMLFLNRTSFAWFRKSIVENLMWPADHVLRNVIAWPWEAGWLALLPWKERYFIGNMWLYGQRTQTFTEMRCIWRYSVRLVVG